MQRFFQLNSMQKMVDASLPAIQAQDQLGLMHLTMTSRKGKAVTLDDGSEVVEFVTNSYLGLEMHPKIIGAARDAVEEWGLHFCCARSRISLDLNKQLEERLARLFGARVVAFPSVTATHSALLPLIASGVLLGQDMPPVTLVYDRFAHASTHFLKPILAQDAETVTIPHNDLGSLEQQIMQNRRRGRVTVYIADALYAIGGAAPLARLLELAQEPDVYLYLDDAHGTSLFGEKGEGLVVAACEGRLPQRVFVAFSLSKAFGCKGGGICLPNGRAELLLRYFGQTYAFSASMDSAAMGSAMASLDLHEDGTVKRLQQDLRQACRFLRRELELEEPETFSPICSIPVGDEKECIELSSTLRANGYYVPAAVYPMVPLGQAQLRACVSSSHSEEQLTGLARLLREKSRKRLARPQARQTAGALA